jgi:mono/diheme cytochrome c family protein
MVSNMSSRTPHFRRLGWFSPALYFVAIASTFCDFANALNAAEPSPEQTEFFETKIRPVLINRCFECHGNGQAKGGLSLENRDSFLKGGETGTIIEPGKPDESTLIEAIRHDGAVKMPPKHKLPDREIADLTNWVTQGASWPTLSVKIPLGNLFDDVAETSLGDAVDSDQFKAAADATDLGVDRVVQGWGTQTEIASGIKFDFQSLGSGTETHGLVMNDAWGDNGGIRTLGQKFDSNGPRTEAGIGMHSNALITFDLTEIRKAGNLTPTQAFLFRSDRAGLNDDVASAGGNIHLAVIVSRSTGAPHEKVLAAYVNGAKVDVTFENDRFAVTGAVPSPLTSNGKFANFEVPLPPEAQFITLVSTAAGAPGESNPISSDHAVFSEARLEFESPTVTVAQLGRAAPISEYVITPQQRAFWSFQPVQNAPPPAVKDVGWVKKPLDAFILAELEQRGLKPVAAADRAALLRRVSYDLTGLPPAPEDVTAFVNDTSTDAWEKVVDRLLASPHYGERWGRHWLDVARYAEDQAHTFQARTYPSGYRYRDWVVNSINRDKPYDRFLMEQIAGDLLSDDSAQAAADRVERLPALGYFALGPVYYQDAGCAAKAAADELDDRVDTLARGILGLTVACARCHDHKFDPISQRDYYSIAGVFSSSAYQEAPLVAPDVVERYQAGQKTVKEQETVIQKFLESQIVTLQDLQVRESTTKLLVTIWKSKHPLANEKEEGRRSRREAARNAGVPSWQIDRWEKFLSSKNKEQVPQLKAWYELPEPDANRTEPVPEIVTKTAEAFQNDLVAALDARDAVKKQHEEAVGAAPEAEKSKLKQPDLPQPHAGLIELIFHKQDGPGIIPNDKVDSVLAGEPKQKHAELKTELERRQKEAPPMYAVAHSLTEGKPADMRIYLRGNHQKPGPEAPRRFLGVLTADEPKPFSQGSGRLELAQAITNPNNPLTARVIVNRIWQQHFGRGIVGTPSNFGNLGERPSHPQLLDHLAHFFMTNGWSLKKLHREIVLSTTYQLSSGHDAHNIEVDADNRYLWRMNRRRLDVEAWRDALLAVSGGLDPTVGGPSGDLGSADNKRRTLYGKVSRHDLNPLLRLFDFPDPNITSEKRTQTTVPLQLLFVLNSEFLVRQAQALAKRLTSDPAENDGDRIRRAYLLLYGRPATDDEIQLGQGFLQATAITDDKGQPAMAQLSAWQQYTQILLGANEFTYID